MNCDLDNLFDESKAMFEVTTNLIYNLRVLSTKRLIFLNLNFLRIFFQIFAYWIETPATFLIRNWKCPQNICILECLFNFHFLWKMHQNCSNVTWNRSQGMNGVKSDKNTIRKNANYKWEMNGVENANWCFGLINLLKLFSIFRKIEYIFRLLPTN